MRVHICGGFVAGYSIDVGVEVCCFRTKTVACSALNRNRVNWCENAEKERKFYADFRLRFSMKQNMN